MYSSEDLKEFSGATARQLEYWCSRGYLASRYMNRRTGSPVQTGGSGYNRVFDATDLSIAKVLHELGEVMGNGGDRGGRGGVASALRSLPLGQWPGRSLVVRADSVSIDGPIGTAALVVDLGACVVGAGKAREGLGVAV